MAVVRVRVEVTGLKAEAKDMMIEINFFERRVFLGRVFL